MNETAMLELSEQSRARSDKARARQTDSSDHTIEYRDWHRSLHRGWYVNDIDQIEWRADANGRSCPVALIELTELKSLTNVNGTLRQILNRFENKTAQGDFSRMVADRLCCNAYVVAYVQGLKYFWLYNLSEHKGWVKFSKDQYEHWLSLLTPETAKRQTAKRLN